MVVHLASRAVRMASHPSSQRSRGFGRTAGENAEIETDQRLDNIVGRFLACRDVGEGAGTEPVNRPENPTHMEGCEMTIVRRPSPIRDMLTMRQAVDRFFDDEVRPFRWLAGGPDGPALPLDVTADSDRVTIEAALPGTKPEDVDITVEDNIVTITGKTAEERKAEEGSYVLQEIRRGSFSRTVSLPQGLEPDKATATFEHGILRLEIPKAEQLKPRQIKISPITTGKAERTPERRDQTDARSDESAELRA
ncbi:MAG TPA: Hsp20/alpha crystallin family protein [Candidatus Limnocylindria bacterium]|nr:Hsp20/alpha crystallin family protein [Candidatus Limnocylindria bacterium]